MIGIDKIRKFMDRYHHYSWILQIPFVAYFGVALYNLENVKTETLEMKDVLEYYMNENQENVCVYSEELAYLSTKKLSYKAFYKTVKTHLDFILGEEFENAEDFVGEIHELEDQMREILQTEDQIFRIDPEYLDWSLEYPEIKRYVSLKLAGDLNAVLASRLFSFWSCCYPYKYFNPVVYKMENTYLLYPNRISSCSYDILDVKINGEKIEDLKFEFHPKGKGLHVIDAEISYLFNNEYEVMSFKNELWVE